jgi:hypothetical protein
LSWRAQTDNAAICAGDVALTSCFGGPFGDRATFFAMRGRFPGLPGGNPRPKSLCRCALCRDFSSVLFLPSDQIGITDPGIDAINAALRKLMIDP